MTRTEAETADFSATMSETFRTFSTTPWEPVDVDYRDGTYAGRYRVDLAGEYTDDAPHRPLVHGSTLYTIAEYHGLVSLLFAVYHQHHPAFAQAVSLPVAETRRRLLLASMDVTLRKPVFDPLVTVRMTIENVRDKWEAHRMIFADLVYDVADGSHRGVLTSCLNARDDLIGA